MAYLLGVDGGGTKMLGALAALDGKIIKKIKTGPASYHAVGIEQVEKNLKELLEGLVGKDLNEVKACCLGFSGCGRPSDYEILNPMLKRVGIFNKTDLFGDMAIGLMGGALEPKGVIVIAGTGSIVYGIGEDGVAKRAGGYGQWYADEGSGFRIGNKALRAIFMAQDGRIKPVSFEKPALKFLKLKQPNDLILWATEKNKAGTIKTDIASVAPFVIEAAKKGDKTAKQILKEEIDELVLAVRTVVKGIKSKGLPKVVLVGGLVENNPLYFNAMKKAIQKDIKGIQVNAPKACPAIGAVIGAAKKAGIEITPAFIKNLTTSWKKLED
jgi:N-acetylglucosamine kinase-like BadF-type ATPase